MAHDYPERWTLTKDGVRFEEGSRLYDPFDGKYGIVGPINRSDGWFKFTHDDGSTTMLNSQRVLGTGPNDG